MLITFDPEVMEMYKYKHKKAMLIHMHIIFVQKMTSGIKHSHNCRWPAPQSHEREFTLTTCKNTFLHGAIGGESGDRVTQPVPRGVDVYLAGKQDQEDRGFREEARYTTPIKRWRTKNACCAAMWMTCR